MAASWQARRNAMASAWPRTTAASCLLSLRGGSGRRALPPISPGLSAAKETSRSALRALARRQPATACLKGSVGDSLIEDLGLMFAAMASYPAAHQGEGKDQLSTTFTALSGSS